MPRGMHVEGLAQLLRVLVSRKGIVPKPQVLDKMDLNTPQPLDLNTPQPLDPRTPQPSQPAIPSIPQDPVIPHPKTLEAPVLSGSHDDHVLGPQKARQPMQGLVLALFPFGCFGGGFGACGLGSCLLCLCFGGGFGGCWGLGVFGIFILVSGLLVLRVCVCVCVSPALGFGVEGLEFGLRVRLAF